MSVEKTAARDVIRVFNKHVLNPVMLVAAGRGRFYAWAELPPRRRRAFERFGVKSFVHLNLAADGDAPDGRAES